MSDTFQIELERLEDYRFRIDFGSPAMGELIADEPPPLGKGAGPNPARLLAAAVGNCLGASLLFCLRRSRVEVDDVRVRVGGEYVRNERNRLRIGQLDVTIELATAGADATQLEKCLGMFEDFCVVTASVRKGLSVSVQVVDPAGKKLFAST